MDIKHCYINYATLKRRGYNDKYEYIYTVHKYPVRMAGYEDIDFLKTINNRLESGNTDDEVRFASSIARSRSKVLQLGCNNKWDYFVTLTISPNSTVDRYNFKEVIKSLLKFFNNYQQRHSPEFKYVVIPEKHQDGAYHFHGFFANISKSDLQVNEYGYLDFIPYCKKYGFCSMSVIKDTVACANYVSKYITKDMFNGTIPEPRTHLYYASRGLKYDELLRSGIAVPVSLDVNTDCTEVSSAYCTRYFCKRDIFSDAINDIENTAVAPQLPTDKNIIHYKKRLLYDFCNRNNIAIGEKTDLLNLYNALREEIIGKSLTEYESLRQHYYNLRHWFKSEQLSPSDLSKLDDLFNLSYVSEVIDDESSEPVLSEPVIVKQLDIWGDDYVDK
jgi:hypothetical protein